LEEEKIYFLAPKPNKQPPHTKVNSPMRNREVGKLVVGSIAVRTNILSDRWRTSVRTKK